MLDLGLDILWWYRWKGMKRLRFRSGGWPSCSTFLGRHEQMSDYPREGTSDRWKPNIAIHNTGIIYRNLGKELFREAWTAQKSSCPWKPTLPWVTTEKRCIPGALVRTSRQQLRWAEKPFFQVPITAYITLGWENLVNLGNFLSLVSFLCLLPVKKLPSGVGIATKQCYWLIVTTWEVWSSVLYVVPLLFLYHTPGPSSVF